MAPEIPMVALLRTLEVASLSASGSGQGSGGGG
jgi:hypothetical protein